MRKVSEVIRLPLVRHSRSGYVRHPHLHGLVQATLGNGFLRIQPKLRQRRKGDATLGGQLGLEESLADLAHDAPTLQRQALVLGEELRMCSKGLCGESSV